MNGCFLGDPTTQWRGHEGRLRVVKRHWGRSPLGPVAWTGGAAGRSSPYAIALADRGLMALAGLWETCRREGAQLRNHHNDAERGMRGASQPDASGLKVARCLARRGTRRRVAAQSPGMHE